MATKKSPKKKADKEEKGLNLKQELFVRFYTQNDELRGSATLSYAEAYGYKLDELPDDDAVYEDYDEKTGEGKGKIIEPSTQRKAYNVCSTEASKLLKNPKIQEKKTLLLNELLEDRIVDSRLAYWIQSDKEPSASIAAIREYNKLRQRITDRHELTGKDGGPIEISGVKVSVQAHGT